MGLRDLRKLAQWQDFNHADSRAYRRPTIVYHDKKRGIYLLVARRKLSDICPSDRVQGELDIETSDAAWWLLREDQAREITQLDQLVQDQYKQLDHWAGKRPIDYYELEWPYYVRHVMDHWLYNLATPACKTQSAFADPLPLGEIEDEAMSQVLNNMRNDRKFSFGVRHTVSRQSSTRHSQAMSPQTSRRSLGLATRSIREDETIASDDDFYGGADDVGEGEYEPKYNVKNADERYLVVQKYLNFESDISYELLDEVARGNSSALRTAKQAWRECTGDHALAKTMFERYYGPRKA